MSARDDVIDYRAKVEEEIASPQRMAAYALLGLAEEVNAGTSELADALADLDLGGVLGSAIERGLDSAGQEIAQAIERGLLGIAQAIADQ